MRDYSFGNFLHELRLRRGLTQYQLGALVGVSDKAVSKWENGSSRPQSNILYKLCEVLGISVDELLTCKYHTLENKDKKGVFAMKKQLWNKAFDAMCKRYGNPAPIAITNRFLTEQAEMQNTDMIVYFDMLSALAAEARKRGEHICVRGGTGASFVAYLLGATGINPLKPHYYCPECHKVVFDGSADDGWDLAGGKCSCGQEMCTDGHDIPFETYRHVVRRNTSFDVSVSPEFIPYAKAVVQDYFRDCKLTPDEREPGRVITFAVSSGSGECSVTLCADDEMTRHKALEEATGTRFERVRFAFDTVLKEICSCHAYGIAERFMKDFAPKTFHDLIQIQGLSLWGADADTPILRGYPVGKAIAYRDDVFNRIQEKMLANGMADTGFAYRVMEDTRRGLYAKNGVPDDVRADLKAIGMEDGFVEAIGRIRYLFPKAYGVACVRSAAIRAWYKLNYPEEFKGICGTSAETV